jgi:hypothetical protein
VDRLDWNIDGYLFENYWNVLSELIWRDLKIFQVQFGNETIVKDRFYFRGDFRNGWILSGSNQDTDFSGNDRTNPLSESKNDSSDGSVSDLSFGIGYVFNVLRNRIDVIPIIGFSHSEQNLTITDGYQTISEEIPIDAPYVGSFSGLDSSYESNWLGPWIGLDLSYARNDNNRLAFSFEYHWAKYYATADWNLIDSYQHPKSFEHQADGYGILFKSKWHSQFYKNWYYDFRVDYQRWQTNPGTQRTFFSSGSISETRLNEVNWESLSFMLGLSYHF